MIHFLWYCDMEVRILDTKMLEAINHLDTESGFRLRYVKSDTEYFRPHFHNYYEIFLILQGNVRHFINGTEQLLTRGNLLFIRDFDIHDYASADGTEFHFLNLAIEKNALDALFLYLGDGFPAKTLLSAVEPPTVLLSPREQEKMFYSLMELHSDSDKQIAKTMMRTKLVYLFTNYFQNYSPEKIEIPLWLELGYEKMKSPANFVQGMERFLVLTGKSREHLSRMMKKHYHITPTEFITELRLNYAVNLMQTSNLKMTEICYECGFSNLSWFYKAFEHQYGQSPANYKRFLKQS